MGSSQPRERSSLAIQVLRTMTYSMYIPEDAFQGIALQPVV